MLLPSSGLVQVGGQARADRFTYLAQIGLFTALVWTLATPPASRTAGGAPVRWPIGLGATVAAALSLLTHAQALRWTDGVTLFRHSLAVTGPNPLILEYLATAHELRDEPAPAATLLLESVQRWPHHASTWRHLSRVLVTMDRPSAAIDALLNAAALEPDHADTHLQLALLFESTGDTDASTFHAQRAAALAPDRALPPILQTHVVSTR
jgi:cytochrome c-type biogenesis protein CcmH/NrfG